jgi:hypothetical protein
MPAVNLKNITIKKLIDKNLNDYFLIVNNDNQEEAYFCFEKTIKESEWIDLINDYEAIREVELEFEVNDRGYKRVISLYPIREGEIIV